MQNLGKLFLRKLVRCLNAPACKYIICMMVMMVIVVICMVVMNRFGEGEEQAVMM